VFCAENKMTIATENLRSAQNTLDHSQRMFRKGYISALDLASQTFSVERAQLELDSANTAKEVLVKYTKEKTLQDLTSKRDSTEAMVRSETASFALEESRLKRLEGQMLKCVIMAPADGMVVYANETDHHGMSQQAQIEEGAAVRERQTILRLPDLAQMQAKVNVHESRVESLGRALRAAERAGNILPARIEVQNLKLQGRLLSIANQPAPIDFRTGNIKQYAAIIAIEGTQEGLRPGMTAKCEVVVEQLADVLMIPVAAVVEQGGKYQCWVVSDTDVECRFLVLGVRNEEVVEVQDGVGAGELVVLNPRATVPEARSLHEQAIPTKKAAKRFDKILNRSSDS
jgi:multidrug efflux pump subunit AcrA (membrane-fusion protein)